MFTSLKHTTCHTASQLVYLVHVGIETQAMRCVPLGLEIDHVAQYTRAYGGSRPILTCKI